MSLLLCDAVPPVCVTECVHLCRDTAGQERYQTITKQYYRRAQVIQHALSASWMVGLFSNVPPCAGYHLCLWHHKPAVLSAPGQVGQWCGRSELSLINSAISGELQHVCDAFLLFSSTLQTWCRGSWWETNVMTKSGGRWQKTKEARFESRSFD